MKPGTPSAQKTPFRRGLRLIAAYKFIQGLLLLGVGVGLWVLRDQDLNVPVEHWLAVLQVDADNDFFQSLLTKLDAARPGQIQQLSLGLMLYAAICIVEGVGLLLQKQWAEVLTVLVTGSFLPLECSELTRHFLLSTLAILGINLAVFWYLCNQLVKARRKRAVRAGGVTPLDN